MRYKNKVSELVSNSTNILQLIKRGLEGNKLTAQEVVDKINQTLATLEDVSNENFPDDQETEMQKKTNSYCFEK